MPAASRAVDRKITTANGIQKSAPSGPALSIVQYFGNYFGFKKKILDSTNRVSSKSIENSPCACAVERHERTVSRNLNQLLLS